MRSLFASLAAVAALGIAAPAFAQTDAAPPAPVPVAKPKPGTEAYCKTLKSTTSRNACLKRVHAQAMPAAKPAPKPAATATKTKKPPAAAHTNAPAAMAPATSGHSQAQAQAPAPAPATPAPPQTIQVPPLPQKTI
jgi:hypothetical protein